MTGRCCWRRRSPALRWAAPCWAMKNSPWAGWTRSNCAGGFFDFEEKYTLKTSAIHCPARISPEKAQEIQQAAKTVYRALDCRGFARVDLFLTPEGRIVFNEVNTIPGFTAHSRYPSMMKADRAGLPEPGHPHRRAGGGGMRTLTLHPGAGARRAADPGQPPAHPLRRERGPELAAPDGRHPDILLERRAARLLAACVQAVRRGGGYRPGLRLAQPGRAAADLGRHPGQRGRPSPGSMWPCPGAVSTRPAWPSTWARPPSTLTSSGPTSPRTGSAASSAEPPPATASSSATGGRRRPSPASPRSPGTSAMWARPTPRLMEENGLCLEEYRDFAGGTAPAVRPGTGGRAATVSWLPCPG